jgi:hypothetical protein
MGVFFVVRLRFSYTLSMSSYAAEGTKEGRVERKLAVAEARSWSWSSSRLGRVRSKSCHLGGLSSVVGYGSLKEWSCVKEGGLR